MHNVLNKTENQELNLVDSDLSLLKQAEAEGMGLPFGCTSGACGACLIIIDEGADQLSPVTDIEMKTLERLTENRPELNGKKIRLSCQAKVKGDLSFSLPS